MTTPTIEDMLKKIHYEIKPTCFENILSKPCGPVQHLMIGDVLDWMNSLTYWDKAISYDERDKLRMELVEKWRFYRKNIYAQNDYCVTFIFWLLP